MVGKKWGKLMQNPYFLFPNAYKANLGVPLLRRVGLCAPSPRPRSSACGLSAAIPHAAPSFILKITKFLLTI